MIQNQGFYENNPNTLLYRIPAQTASKPNFRSATNFIDAIDILRLKVRDQDPKEYEELRRRERILETFKKNVEEIELALPCQAYWAQDTTTADLLKSITPHWATQLIGLWEHLEKMNQQHEKKLTPYILPKIDHICKVNDEKIGQRHTALLPFVKSFYESPGKAKNLYEYLMYKKTSERIELYKELARSYGNENNIQIIDDSFDNKESLDAMIKRACVFQEVTRYLISFYHLFKNAEWDRNTSFQEFHQQLKEKGPLIMVGHIGNARYIDAPTLKGRIASRNIYGWSPRAPQKEVSSMRAVIIIGAGKSESQELVYFIDPLDGCDPNNEEQQRIYVMSYKRLTESAVPIYQNKSQDPVYAIHHFNYQHLGIEN